MRRGKDGLMHIESQAHARLQIMIAQWMMQNIEPAENLKKAGGAGTVDEVSCRAANAAAESVAHSLEILGHC